MGLEAGLGFYMAVSANIFGQTTRDPNFAPGEMAERSIAAVLKTVEVKASGGSNPSLSAFRVYILLIEFQGS